MHGQKEQVEHLPAPDTLIHLGAGLCQELDHWRATGSRRIVLVEPNPELLPQLKQRAASFDHVEIIPMAAAATNEREPLRLFNFPLLASLREPSRLHEILPGLRPAGRAMVEARRLEDLLAELDLDRTLKHMLVIDTPGMEAEIVDQLIDQDWVSAFDTLLLTAGHEAWYHGAESLGALIEKLEKAGYEAVHTDTQSDPDWPRATLRFSHHALENRRLSEELKRLSSQNEEFRCRFSELTEKYESLEQTLAERQSLIESLTVERDEQTRKAQTSAEQVENLILRTDELSRVLEEKMSELTSSNETLGLRDAEAGELKEKVDQLTSEVGTLKSLESLQEQASQKLEQVSQSRDNLQIQLQNRTEETQKLKIRASRLEEDNEDYKERHKLLEEELLKAEAQIELIKQMFLSDDDSLNWDDDRK